MPLIAFLNPTRDSTKVSPYSRRVLEDIMEKADVPRVTVIGTTRTAHQQAGILYENIERYGVESQKQLYTGCGRNIIDTYVSLKNDGNTPAGIIAGLNARIVSLGGRQPVAPAGEAGPVQAVDIAPGAITLALRDKFESAAVADARVSAFVAPPRDPAYHLEIPQPPVEAYEPPAM